MSAYTTLYITRSRAIEEIFARQFSDDQLASFMDTLLEPRLYNCIIVSDDEETNDNDML